VKKIEAIIRPEKLDAVRQALENVGSCPGVTVSRVDGHGKQKGVVQQFRGLEYNVSLLPKMKIEIVVNDEDLQRCMDAVADAARTGEVGDGKIFVSSIDDVLRIRTGESGTEAV
jgi:nitrogen regulatory protein P-II 1